MNTTNTTGFSSDRLNRIDTVLQRYIDQQQLAGVVTMIARQGQIVHHKSFGWQDVSSQTPMALDSIFRIFSMTKPIVCAALLLLLDEGLFQLSDPISKFIPEFGQTKVMLVDKLLVEPEQPITIRQLLTHTAGLGYGFTDISPVEEMCRQANLEEPGINLQEMISRLAKIPLLYQPGQGWHYSYAIDVIGRVIEVLAGLSLAQFLEQRVFQPLGMVDTAFWVPVDKNERFAKLYELNNKTEIEPLPDDFTHNYRPEAATLFAGGSGLVSTATDYLQFAQLMLNNGELNDQRLLGRKTVELMTTNHLPPHLMPINYNGVINQTVPGFGMGLGVRVMTNPGLTGVMGSMGSYGWGGWANTVLWIDPQEELIEIFMTQCITDNVHPIRNDFRTLVYQALVDKTPTRVTCSC